MAVAFDAYTDAYTSSLVPSGSATLTVWVKLATDKNSYSTIAGWSNGSASPYRYAGTDTDGTTHSYEGGHYISVVGYRDGGETVKIADSANPNTASYWITVEHLADWIATRGYATS